MDQSKNKLIPLPVRELQATTGQPWQRQRTVTTRIYLMIVTLPYGVVVCLPISFEVHVYLAAIGSSRPLSSLSDPYGDCCLW